MNEGGRICLSDDSHGTAQVGLNYSKMREYLVGQGVTAIWHLVAQRSASGMDQPVGSRDRVRARKVEGWAEDSFWTTNRGEM
jgi:histidinol-phosphatase (PHP family)